MIAKALYSSATDEWSTPPDFFAKVEEEFGPFDLDPCATAENAKAPKFYTKADDGLFKSWAGRVWMNPPYGNDEAPCKPDCSAKRCAKRKWHRTEHYYGSKSWVRRASGEFRSSHQLIRKAELAWLGRGDEYKPSRVDLVAALLPARTDTAWWHDYVIPYASEIRFIRGRLKFGGAKNSAPFPSALIIFKRA
jgi:phage N-6-adenine-methyltransferase